MSKAVFDPAHVLGCTPREAVRLLGGRRVTPGEVESLAATHYDWRRHLRDPRSYWVASSEAARILRVSPSVVKRMLETGRLPHIVHVSGVRLMAREEIERRARVR